MAGMLSFCFDTLLGPTAQEARGDSGSHGDGLVYSMCKADIHETEAESDGLLGKVSVLSHIIHQLIHTPDIPPFSPFSSLIRGVSANIP